MRAVNRQGEGGGIEPLSFGFGRCTLGAVAVASSSRGLVAVLLGDDPELLMPDLRARFPRARWLAGGADQDTVVARVIAHVEQPDQAFDLPLDPRGTAFQKKVWRALRSIPAGATASYAAIAEQLESAKATRAVAGACAANPLAVVVPCHRVVRRDGGLSGYRWGIERKRALLAREASLSIG